LNAESSRGTTSISTSFTAERTWRAALRFALTTIDRVCAFSSSPLIGVTVTLSGTGFGGCCWRCKVTIASKRVRSFPAESLPKNAPFVGATLRYSSQHWSSDEMRGETKSKNASSSLQDCEKGIFTETRSPTDHTSNANSKSSPISSSELRDRAQDLKNHSTRAIVGTLAK
jgi:hypothetical protein